MSDSAASLSAPRPHHARGMALMLFSTVCFTANVLLIRAVAELHSVNVWLVSTIRFVVGIAVLLTVYRRETQFIRLFTRPKLAGRGLVGGIGVYAFYLTVVHIGAGRATFINNTYVAIGGLLAVWFLREPFRASIAIGSALALAGLALMTNAFAANSHAGWYDLVAIAAAFGSAYVAITIRLLHAQGEHTATIFAAQCVYGILICATPAAFHLESISLGAWALMLIAGAGAAAGQLAMTRAFRDLPVAEGSLVQIIVPVGIAMGGVAFFHEHFALHDMIGAALILAGMVLTLVRNRKA
jgi:drug/metabolite transporter (DMT)-like permease